MTGPGQMRAGDADRDRVAERLREAMAEGRLDAAEFNERLDACYAARTLADLASLTADLPPADFYPIPRPLAPPALPEPSPAGARAREVATRLTIWLAVFAVANVAWGVAGAAVQNYWPGWLLVWLAFIVIGELRGGAAARRGIPIERRGRQLRQRAGERQRQAPGQYRRLARQRYRRRRLPP